MNVDLSVKDVEASYELAKERYAELGVDVDAALEKLKTIPISLHCWQGDDVLGFENPLWRLLCTILPESVCRSFLRATPKTAYKLPNVVQTRLSATRPSVASVP